MDDKTKIALMVLGTATFGVFSYSVWPIFNPILFFALLLFFLYPIRKNLYAGRIISVASFLFLLWFFSAVSGVLTPFIIGFVVAYLTEPIVELLGKRKISRTISAALITLIVVGLLVTAIVLVIPAITEQVTLFVNRLGDFQTILFAQLDEFGKSRVAEILNIDTSVIKERIPQLLAFKSDVTSTLLGSITASVTSGVPALVAAVSMILLTPFMTFYFITYYDNIADTMIQFFSEKNRQSINEYLTLINTVLRQYIRGQLIIAFIELVVYSTAFYFIGVPYPFLLSFISALMSLVPTFGILISILFGVVFSLFAAGSILKTLLLTGITYTVMKLTEDFFLYPKIVGSQVGLNPIVLILSIFLFGHFFGFFGILLAVPISAILVTIVTRKFLTKKSDPPKPDAETPKTTDNSRTNT
jgi:predicted PurR-regulated permease PerM